MEIEFCFFFWFFFKDTLYLTRAGRRVRDGQLHVTKDSTQMQTRDTVVHVQPLNPKHGGYLVLSSVLQGYV